MIALVGILFGIAGMLIGWIRRSKGESIEGVFWSAFWGMLLGTLLFSVYSLNQKLLDARIEIENLKRDAQVEER